MYRVRPPSNSHFKHEQKEKTPEKLSIAVRQRVEFTKEAI
jgi:hypothetical protein